MKLFDPDKDTYIWISRWKEFQHYRPDPKRGPAWIKDYTAQLDDERYLELTDRQRALLRDLRDIFATTRGRLSRDSRTITRHRHRQTRDADLDALNHAGFIQFLSRESLELALEDLYSRGREEKEKEKGEERKPPEDPEPPPGFTTPHPDQELQILRLLGSVTGADNGTEKVVRSFAERLPEGAIAKVLETAAGKPAAYAVSALKDECRERRLL